MALTPEDRYHLDKWWLFSELKSEFLVSDPSNISTVFHLREHDAPTKTVQSRLLEHITYEMLDDKWNAEEIFVDPTITGEYGDNITDAKKTSLR